MIKNLEGTRETEDFQEFTSIVLYENVEFEEYPNHWHSSMEIIMPLEGPYTIKAGDVKTTLDVGDIAFIAPGVLHTLYAAPGRRIIFLVDISKVKFPGNHISSIISFIHPSLIVTKDTFPEIHSECKDAMLQIMNEYFSNNQFKGLGIYAYLLNMMILIGRNHTNKIIPKLIDSVPDKQQEYLDKFMSIGDYIHAHYSEDLTLDEIAEMAGFSKYHFERLFKNFSGMTFYKYLNTYRISQSETFLMDPSYSITDVALNSGFNSISSFIRMFKQLKGCTPTEFKKMNKPTKNRL